MNSELSQPPALAIWLLRNLCARNNREALTGDLLERFGEGQSGWWFWRQVLIAIMAGAITELRDHWPQIAFSISGNTLLWFWWGKTMRSPAIEGLWVRGIALPWPLSSAYDFGFQAVFAALMVQPLLIALLLLNRAFSWLSIFRTLLVSIALFAVLQPLLWATITPKPMTRVYAGAAMRGIALLISAWVGCGFPVNRIHNDGTRNLG